MAKKKNKSRKNKGEIGEPSSPVGFAKTKKGKIVNLGLVDPDSPSWKTSGKPFIVPFKFGA